jgi:hypothetical protein
MRQPGKRCVYLGVVVILITAMRQGPTPRRVRELSNLFGVDRATIARWQAAHGPGLLDDQDIAMTSNSPQTMRRRGS